VKTAFFFIIALAAAFMAGGTVLADENEDKAKEHFLKGKALVEEGACDKAILELKASYDLSPMPLALYNIALCYDELHQYASAVKYLKRYLVADKDADNNTKDAVAARIAELTKFLGTLDLVVEPAGAEITIDGEYVGKAPVGAVLLETGKHDIEVKVGDAPAIRSQVELVSGEAKVITIDATVGKVKAKETNKDPEEALAKGKKKKIGPAPFYALVGITGAMALTAVFTGAFALEKKGEVEDSSAEADGWKSTRTEGRRLAVATDVLIGLSAAGAVTALALAFFTDFKKGRNKEKKTSLVLSPTVGNGTLTMGIGATF